MIERKLGTAGVAALVLLCAGCGNGYAIADPAPSSNVTSDGTGEAPVIPATGVGGRVTTPDGHPVAAATVQRTSMESSDPLTLQVAVTDSDGRYFWPLTPGTWDITVSAPHFQTATSSVVAVADRLATLDFVLVPE
ncbi:MAG: carboxypeptidase-like regulatory domain-containing protein [Pseudonocardiaceae bacterium]